MTTTEQPRAGIALPDRWRPTLILLGVAILLAIVLFWDAIGNLWTRWGEQEELSHSYFIPLISAWLVWENRGRALRSIGAPSVLGAALGVGAVLLLLLGRVTESFLFQQLGLVVAIAGLTAGFGGRSLLRCVAPPILFLVFAVPPPFMLINILSWKFQAMSSILGVAMLKVTGVPVLLSGNVIDLGAYQLMVAEACSGLRYLFPFLSLGIMTAFIARTGWVGRLAIVASTIPITIVMNSFRIAVTGWLVARFGTSHAEGALHFFEGWVVFVLCLIALFGVVAAIGFLSRPRRSAFDVLGSPELKEIPPSAGVEGKLALGTLCIVLALGLGLGRLTTVDALITPDRRQFAELPREFPDFEYSVKELSAEVAEVLAADDALVVDFRTPDGEAYNYYLAYLAARRDGRSWHSPRQCIPGGGWQITSHTIEHATGALGQDIAYNRLMIENRGHRQLVYYWYPQRGRHIANEFAMRFWLTADAIQRRRSDGAMVRIMTIVNEDAGVDEAERVLGDAMQRLTAVLPAYVPN